MSVQEVQITDFNPQTATEAEWEQAHAYRDAIFQEANPDDPLPPREMRRKSMEMMSQHPHFSITVRNAQLHDGSVVGTLLAGFPKAESPNYEQQKIMAIVTIDVAKSHRRQGLGKRLLQTVVEECQKRGDHLVLLQGDAETPAGHAFAEHYGGTVAIVGKENRLYAADVDWDMIQQWHSEGPGRAPGVTIETYQGPLENDMEAYSALYTEVFNQQPLGELEGTQTSYTPEVLRQNHDIAANRGDVWTTMVTREPDGAISGLTEIQYNPQRPHRIAQLLTGVQDQYRGRGLGKWLKAAMMLYIQEHYPDFRFITTNNADSNAPMLSINDRMGFKPYKEQRMYKLKVADVAEKLGL